jgi:hypothetical protein
MTRSERTAVVAGVGQRYQLIAPYLTEPTRRLWAGAEAQAIGWHGLAIVSEATGLSRTTITRAKHELTEPPPHRDRQRHSGGGRKPLATADPTLVRDLDRLVDPYTRGDPEYMSILAAAFPCRRSVVRTASAAAAGRRAWNGRNGEQPRSFAASSC